MTQGDAWALGRCMLPAGRPFPKAEDLLAPKGRSFAKRPAALEGSWPTECLWEERGVCLAYVADMQ